MMEVNLGTPAAGANKASAQAGQAQGSGKSDGQTGLFGVLLEEAGTASEGDDKKQATDPLLALMAALSGGLSPLMLNQQLLQTQDASLGQAGSDRLGVNLTIGTQTLTLPLQALHMNNGELANLLQKFGASPALMGVLLEQPLNQSAQTLGAHPELLTDLGNAMSQALAAGTSQPTLVAANPMMAALMRTVLMQAAADNAQQPQTTSNSKNTDGATKTPKVFGKMLATLSTHSLQVSATVADQSALSQTSASSATDAKATLAGTLIGAGLMAGDTATLGSQTDNDAQSAQPVNSLLNSALLAGANLQSNQVKAQLKAEPVVHMQADQFHNEFAGLLVKRASLVEAPGSHEFRIILQPQGLGEIEVRVHAAGNQISLHFAADTAAAKGMLDSELGSLKSQLQAQGIQFNRIEVTSNANLSDLNYGGMPQERGSSQGYQEQKGNRSKKSSEDDPFSIDALSELEQEAELNAAEPEVEGIDVSA